jgi:hypothetical protein
VPRVRFGHGENQDIPLPWAEELLMKLAKANPGKFGTLLRQVVMENLKVDQNGQGG